jgi:hypothetical protein
MRTYIFYHCLKDNIIELKETGLLLSVVLLSITTYHRRELHKRSYLVKD